MRASAWLFTIVAVTAASQAAAAETNSLVGTWLARQADIQTWSADFVQTRRLKSLTQPLTANGRVWFAAPNRFRWELGNPPQTIAARSGDQMLVISPGLKRIERYPLTGGQTGQWREALSLLEAGFPRSQSDLESRFQILSVNVSGSVCEVVLQPKSSAARRMIPLMKIAFGTDDFTLRSTELQWADGSTMRNDFKNPVMNPKLDHALFAPPLDPEYKIVEPLKARR